MRIRVAAGTYRDRSGWKITGRDSAGRQVNIFATTHCSAERIRARVKAGEFTTLQDFKPCGAPDCSECSGEIH